MSTTPATAEEIHTRAGGLLGALASGDFGVATRDFGDVMQSALPPEKLAETWHGLVAQVGALQAVDDLAVTPGEGLWAGVASARFEKAELLIRMVFDPAGQVVGLFFAPKPAAVSWAPPTYVDLAAFEEREVTVGSGPALPGILAIPRAAGPLPALVLVHGSGPNDEDETVGQVKVFKDLAGGLATRGIAVLRYVKRTRHNPSGVVTQKEEVLDAVRHAVALLRAEPLVDPARIFVLGHSQGGYLAPRIAQENPGLAGVVILAGSTRPLQDSMLEQLTYFQSLDPGNPALAAMTDATRTFKATVEDPALSADQRIDLPTGGSLTGAYFLDVRGYDPPALAATLGTPWLILQGARDYQVTMADFEGWRAALSGKDTAVLRVYPALNHLFVAGEGTPSPAEYQQPGHVAEDVVREIAAWIASREPARGPRSRRSWKSRGFIP
jgi:dienelactone hydrolase